VRCAAGRLSDGTGALGGDVHRSKAELHDGAVRELEDVRRLCGATVGRTDRAEEELVRLRIDADAFGCSAAGTHERLVLLEADKGYLNLTRLTRKVRELEYVRRLCGATTGRTDRAEE